jgi:hypothetical protein
LASQEGLLYAVSVGGERIAGTARRYTNDVCCSAATATNVSSQLVGMWHGTAGSRYL